MKLEIELDIPEAIIDKGFEQELKAEAILLLFGERKISSAHASHLLGLTRLQFLELLTKRHIPHIDYTDEDWEADGRALEELERRQH